MLDLKLLSQEMDARKEEIVGDEKEAQSMAELYRAKLPVIDSIGLDMNGKLPLHSGGKVLEEGRLFRRFLEKLDSRQKATDWALNVLRSRSVAAVDGSQIFPSSDISVPLGLAQACTVINSHTGGNCASTSAIIELMTPMDFEADGSYAYAQAPVSLRRFELECRQMIGHMESHPGNIVFMDGSLVLSFITKSGEKEMMKYVKAVVDVIKASEHTKSPVAAYTDMSMSKDLVTFMRHVFRLPPSGRLTDAFLLYRSMQWGDRTRIFLSDRDDRVLKSDSSVLDLYGDCRDKVAFFYIQSGGGLASKVEVPRWCADEGLIEDIADVIRAECIIRPGYPDIIHRAHEHAAITYSESELFNIMLEGFARKHNINLFKSEKAFNKQLRG